MTTSPDNSLRSELRGKWGWFVALGVIVLALGLFAAANVMTATVATVYWVGILMIVAGIAEIIHAFSVKGWGSSILGILAGILYTIAGFMAFSNPLAASAVFTLFLGIALIVSGIVRVVIGVQERPLEGWGWIVFGGIVTALAGVVIVSGWPVNSLWILGIFLAVDLIVQGISYILVGMGLKRI